METVELVLAVGVSEDEARQIMAGEGLLRVRQGFERGAWIAQQPFAIASGEVAVLIGPFRGPAAARVSTRGGRAARLLGVKGGARGRVGAVIDADVVVEFGQAGVHMLRPGLAPVLQQRRAVPVPRLGAEAVSADLPQR